jgi:hypothetical protein
MVMQDWLTHPDIINLELTPIANWHEHEKLKVFLADSAPAEVSATADGALGAASELVQRPQDKELLADLGADSVAPRLRKWGPRPGWAPKEAGNFEPGAAEPPPPCGASAATPCHYCTPTHAPPNPTDTPPPPDQHSPHLSRQHHSCRAVFLGLNTLKYKDFALKYFDFITAGLTDAAGPRNLPRSCSSVATPGRR